MVISRLLLQFIVALLYRYLKTISQSPLNICYTQYPVFLFTRR